MFTITRQRQWPDGTEMVEVSLGGIDYCNPDALGAKYHGEFKEFKDPRQAVQTAIEICRQWRKDAGKKSISLGIGATYGNTSPFESITFRQAIKWANEYFEKLPKCTRCNEPLPDSKRELWYANDWDGLEYCSEHCAERAAEWEAEEQAKFEQEELQAIEE